MNAASGSFADLRLRILSALVLVTAGVGGVVAGGLVFLLLLTLVAGLMVWELLRMLDGDAPVLKHATIAVIGGVAVFRIGFDSGPLAQAGLMLAPVIGLVVLPRDRGLFLVYCSAVLFAVAGLFGLRSGAGFAWTLWLILVVMAADMGGYFFGRIFGGAKILPRISPKKTWSGTLGGWAMAALIGLGFAATTTAGVPMILLSVLAAIASQAGDVAESAIKRHAGVKDASNLIPGHGGFLDRFDALVAASLFMLAAGAWIGLPTGGTL